MFGSSLFYDSVEKSQKKLTYGSRWRGTIDSNVIERARRIHSLMVQDAAREIFFQSSGMWQYLKNEQARFYIQFGTTRRLEMIWYAYNNLAMTVPSNRTKPLDFTESRQLSQDLNVIYMNIRGVLDNLAWALLYEFSPTTVTKLKPAKIGLFQPCVRHNPVLVQIKPIIDANETWDRDVKERRDPTVHRIPLAIPPSILNQREQDEYYLLEGEYEEAIRERDFDRADGILNSQRELGTFRAWFTHDPEFAPMEMYPTVPDDIAHLIQLFENIALIFAKPSPSCAS